MLTIIILVRISYLNSNYFRSMKYNHKCSYMNSVLFIPTLVRILNYKNENVKF